MNWEDYKKQTKAIDSLAKEDIEEAEMQAYIVTEMIRRRNDLGLSQRDLAEKCDMPQSSIARIESYKTSPKLDTLVKMLQSLGLSLTVTPTVSK